MSDGANGCTFQFDTYQVDYNGELFELIDMKDQLALLNRKMR